MTISASQPRSVGCARTSHTASQLMLVAAAPPPLCAACRTGAAGSPGAAAAAILTRLRDLCVVLDAGRSGAEYEGVLPVVEGVEQDLNRVGILHLAVAAVLRHDRILRLGIQAADADVEVPVVVGEATSVSSVAGAPSSGLRW